MVVSTRTGLVNEMRLAEGDETRRFGKRGPKGRGEGGDGAKERGLKGLKGRSDWLVLPVWHGVPFGMSVLGRFKVK